METIDGVGAPQAEQKPFDLGEAIAQLKRLRKQIDDLYIEVNETQLTVSDNPLSAPYKDEYHRAGEDMFPELDAAFLYMSVGKCEFDEAWTYVRRYVYHAVIYEWNLYGRLRAGESMDEYPPDRVLQALKSISYTEYLQTHHWKRVRGSALHRSGHRCQVCNTGEHQLHVHHRTYERRGEEMPEDVIALCDHCHSLFHANGKLAR